MTVYPNPETLYENIDFVRETVFAGLLTGTVNSISDVKQTYSVGSSKVLTHAGLTDLGNGLNNMGVILPSLREQTCLDTSNASTILSV